MCSLQLTQAANGVSDFLHPEENWRLPPVNRNRAFVVDQNVPRTSISKSNVMKQHAKLQGLLGCFRGSDVCTRFPAILLQVLLYGRILHYTQPVACTILLQVLLLQVLLLQVLLIYAYQYDYMGAFSTIHSLSRAGAMGVAEAVERQAQCMEDCCLSVGVSMSKLCKFRPSCVRNFAKHRSKPASTADASSSSPTPPAGGSIFLAVYLTHSKLPEVRKLSCT